MATKQARGSRLQAPGFHVLALREIVPTTDSWANDEHTICSNCEGESV